MTLPAEHNLQLTFQWTDEGRLLIGELHNNRNDKHIYLLKNALFGWHKKSFYGTLLHIEEIAEQAFIVLDPYRAIDYFAEPHPLQHTNIDQQSGQFAWLTQAAVLLKQALQTGQFAPDIDAWLAGQPGWKLLLASEQEEAAQRLQSEARQYAFPSLQQWFNLAMQHLVNEDASISAAYEAILQAHPLARQVITDKSLRPEEEEWLVSIGWKQDTIPFSAALQLLEPETEQGHVNDGHLKEDGQAVTPNAQWRLQMLLQDKENSDIVAECSLFGEPAASDIPAAWQPHLDGRIPKQIRHWLRIVPELAVTDTTSDKVMMMDTLSEEQAWWFLSEGSLRLAEAGCAVLLPAWWDALKRLTPRLKVQIKSSVGSSAKPMFGLQQIVDFDLKVALGDTDITEEELHSILAQKKRFYHIRGNWIQLDPAYLEQIQKKIKGLKKKGISFGAVLENQLSSRFEDDAMPAAEQADEALRELQIEVEINEHLEYILQQLQENKSLQWIAPPDGFQGTLRPYQIQGASWMVFLHQYGLGGCLADDMGLGKTVQWITYLLHLKQQGQLDRPALLICPTSVLGNWQKELKRFAPALKVHLHYGVSRSKGEDFTKAVQSFDLVITSYALTYLDQAELSSVHWGPLCLDEAQNIKNAYTKQSLAIRKIPADHRIALTGTPIENRLTELWSIFDFINPGYLGALAAFKKVYVNPIERSSDHKLVSHVQKIVRPFLLRRMKKDPAIQLDLPEKNEMKTYISLTPEQGTLYEDILQHLFDKIDRLPPMERRGLILATLTRLKQVCNHPVLTLKDKSGPQQAAQSNKIIRLLEMVQQLRAEGERCLIFTQFVEMGRLIQLFIQQSLQESALFLHGGVAKSKRDQMIEQFQNPSLPAEEQAGIFVLSLKAGGTGLNLTAANHVFHIDRWWNPAVESQATDRAFRIGQQRDVQVHKFITLGTLEERIDEMIERKQSLSEQIVGNGEQWITEMSTGELREVFSLRRNWIKEAHHA